MWELRKATNVLCCVYACPATTLGNHPCNYRMCQFTPSETLLPSKGYILHHVGRFERLRVYLQECVAIRIWNVRVCVCVLIACKTVKPFEDRPRYWMSCGGQGRVTNGWRRWRMVVI